MSRLLGRRLALLLPTLLAVTILVFLFLHLVPGDPVEIMLGEAAAPADAAALRGQLGLDRPVGVQLVRFLSQAVRGDLGQSIAFRAPVSQVIAERYPATIELAVAALGFGMLIGVPLGVLAALGRGGAIDGVARTASLVGVCVPSVCSGPLLVLVFAVDLGWLPPSGRGGASHLVLPAITLGLGLIGILVRMTRASVLGVLGEDHVRTARAKGLPPRRVVIRHVLRNALPPVTTVVGLQAGALLAGAIVVETIFAWPGLGRLVVQAIDARDYPLVQGCVLVIGATYVVVNTLADVVHGLLDPRVRDDG